MRTLALLISLTLATTAGAAEEKTVPAPPEQPVTGHGGRDYIHAAMRVTKHDKGDHEYWLFEPVPAPGSKKADADDPAEPKLKSAPVIVFMHGWGAMSPNVYGAWIEHLVRRGNIVIYPRYQANVATSAKDFTDHTVHAVRNAFNKLRQPEHINPDPKRIAYVGHSVGGLLVANLAARADGRFIPKPAAIMSVQPGISKRLNAPWGVPNEDLKGIDANTLLLTLAGEDDRVTRFFDARRIYRESTAVPAERKSMLVYRTDRRGRPVLEADHRSPIALKYIATETPKAAPENAPGNTPKDLPPSRFAARKFGQAIFNVVAGDTVNAMDYHGYWAMFDRLTEAAWSGDAAKIAPALGKTVKSRAVGAWSDGKIIKPPRVEIVK